MTRLVRHLSTAGLLPGLAATILLMTVPAARAQTAPAAAASAAAADQAISDRVKKDAASPLYWIRLNAQKNDGNAAKPAPRIAEIRPAPAPRTAAPAAAAAPNPTQVANDAPASGSADVAAGPVAGGTAPAAGAGLAAASAESAGTQSAPAPLVPATTPVAPATAPMASATAPAAALVAPSASSAGAMARSAAEQTAAAPPEPDAPLSLVKAEEPEFPVTVMRKMRRGTVQVKFDVLPDGHVANATVVQSSSRALNDAALEAVRAWLFKPVPSARSAIVDLGFDLDG